MTDPHDVPTAARAAFACGVLPALLDEELAALAAGLAADDLRITQSGTTWPYAGEYAENRGLPVEAACVVSYAAWKGGGCQTVGAVVDRFVEICTVVGQGGHDLTPLFAFLDHWPRGEVFAALLELVQAEQKRRKALGK